MRRSLYSFLGWMGGVMSVAASIVAFCGLSGAVLWLSSIEPHQQNLVQSLLLVLGGCGLGALGTNLVGWASQRAWECSLFATVEREPSGE
jgi:hypothetical protein